MASLAIAGVALAVHDLAFQLDGDVTAATTTSVGGNTQSKDWSSFFDSSGAKISGALSTTGSGFTASAFKADFTTTTKRGATVFSTLDPSTFTTGSKDTLDINPGWQCASSNNVLSKNDIMNAYALAYTETATDPDPGHQILYFGLERNSNNGDANVAFWFLQGSVSCDASGGTASFQGHHVDGDLLVVSAFTNGGGVSGIDVYRWNGNGAAGSLGTTPVGHGVDCISGGGTAGGDHICATTNGGDTATGGYDHDITTPWQTANASTGLGNTLQPSEFFEGGVDLTSENLGGHCFNTFVGDTRSSQSLTATIFDYALGQLGECASTTTTQAKDGSGSNLSTVAIPATGTLAVKDTATVNVTGVSSFNGTVQFYLCGPSTTSISTCSSSGTAIGSTHAITSNGSVDQTATLTSAGYYCWHAVFSGDSNLSVPGSEDDSTHECFRVTPLQPTLPTLATVGPVDFGQKISDTVTLTGSANKPGTGGVGPGGTINTTRGSGATGNINLTAYGPDSCSTVAYGPVSIAANGDGAVGGTGTTFEFTPTAPGQYVFVASYDGDSPNTLSVSAVACASQPSNEKVTVRTIPTEISTAPSYFPQDSATITSSVTGNNLAANGTVTFSLYQDTAGPVTALANCQAAGTTGRVYGPEAVLTGVAAHSATVGTNNTTYRISDGRTYYWLVTYAPPTGDTAHTGIQSNCVENITGTLVGDTGPGTIFPAP